MEKVDSRKIQVFDVPIKESSPGTKEKERSIEPVYLFSDDIRKEWLETRKLPLPCAMIHERLLDISAI